MWLCVYIVFVFLHGSTCVDLVYHVEEEKNIGTYIGNIASDSRLWNILSLKYRNLVTFNQLAQRPTRGSQLFNVTKTGKLFTIQTIDAESLCIYNTECFDIIKIALRHAQTFIKVLKVKIVIKDVNDNQPGFPIKAIDLKFDETNGKGTKKSLPNAVDKDVGILNSQIVYTLKKSNEPFSLTVSKRVDGTSKLDIVLGETLDRESVSDYYLQVIAKDGGSPPLQGVLDVHITVLDINDNAPVFTQEVYNVTIKHTHQRSMPVVVLSAKDRDSKENSKITYHFSSKTSDIAKHNFKLNDKTGEIFLLQRFFSEQLKNYKLFVEAKDGGNPPLSSIATVIVNLINQQNNAPEIDVNFVSEVQKNIAAISEGMKVGSFIAYVSVIDKDVGLNGEVHCTLNSEKFQLLNLGSNEYKIIIKKEVDREKQDHYSIKISCQDKGSPPLWTERKFSIQVIDVNDVQPHFTKDTFKFLTYENEEPNFPVGFINATDPDLGDGGQLLFSVINDNQYPVPFQITNYGFLSTTKALDREQSKSYVFKVSVSDNGTPPLNSTANIIVEVMDENDNAPYFTFPSVNPFSLDVHYHPQSKNDITVLRASDRDSRENAFLTFLILAGNNKQLFTINPHSGVLAFSRPVYQNDAGSYNLLLVVKDSGSPVLSATTTLSLTLTVSNRTSPMLTAAHIQSSDMIDINLVIIIVVTAVVISIAIVVIITICIVRCNRRRTMLHTAAMNPAMQPGREKCLMISQSNNPFAITQNPEEGVHHSTPSMRSRRDFCPEQELPVEWTSLTSPGKRLSASQACIQEVGMTSGRHERRFIATPDHYGSNVSPHKLQNSSQNKKDMSPYEEIPVVFCVLASKYGKY
ncbi:protocadherin gamma-A4-like isoform X3 [Octopus vulgaris]|uniref:Protocadherin gamma-A4-like isoform X3 n=1 Tax=Octopus vulgaris TaxID=6645 RepID=A0AA36BEA5_OCTVU|nr:protocadherin gamma-A4-like isoform X3 [Octopus vulgaris]